MPKACDGGEIDTAGAGAVLTVSVFEAGVVVTPWLLATPPETLTPPAGMVLV